MSWARVAAARVRALFARDRLDRELDDEVRFHLEMQIENNLRDGMNPADARAAAERSFGGQAGMKETYRERRTIAAIETTAQDLRYALRTLRRSPIFALTAICTLALAVGANTTMFGVVNAVLLRPLPYREPQQLAMLWTGLPGQRQGRTAYLTADEWRRRSKSFADMAVYDPASATRTDVEGAERISVMRVSPRFFTLLDVRPMAGRLFSVEEAEARQHVAVIGYRFWQTRFGGSAQALSRAIVLDGVASQIVGIVPDLDSLAADVDVWVPHTAAPDWDSAREVRGPGSWFVIARLKPEVTFDQAQAEMTAIAQLLDAELPASSQGDRDRGASVVPLIQHVVGPTARLAVWVLAGALACVLFIAAANVAGLSVARSADRAHELALRAALGASPARIARQLLVESITLSAIAGAAGTALAVAGIRLVRTFGPADLARLNEASFDLRVLEWGLGISLVAGVLVGLLPALAVLRQQPRLSISGGHKGLAAGGGRRGIRRGLVVAECALTIVLLSGAALLLRSWLLVTRVDPGFTPEQVLSVNLSTTGLAGSAQRFDFYDRVLEQVRSIPGVVSAGIIGDLFVNGDTEQLLTADGQAESAPARVRLRVDEISAGLFTTLGTRLVAGRLFTPEDNPYSPRVVIVNEAMARRVWPGQSSIGKRFKFGPREGDSPWFTVVGVVGDMRRQGLEAEPFPQVFQPLSQNPSRLGTLLVRTSTDDALNLGAAVRTAVGRVDKRVPVYGMTTVEDQLAARLAQRRFQTTILLGFSAAALLMAALGIYGLIHYSVAMRTQEIGIRMAVGASGIDIFRMVVVEGLQLAGTGLAVGLVGALAAGRAASSLLFGVSGSDPVTLVAVSVTVVVVAVAACSLPARRAMKVEPMTALRQA